MMRLLQENRAWLFVLLGILVVRMWLASYIPIMEFTEARYAEIARKAFVLDQWIPLWFRDQQPFWGKPPLAFWSTTVSYFLFGVNELTTRLPSMLYTLMTLITLALWLIRLERSALVLPVWFVYCSFFIVMQSAGTILTDPLMTFCTTTVMLAFWQCMNSEDHTFKWALILWVCLGIGLLTKGPVVLVLCGLACGAWAIGYGKLFEIFRRTYFLPGLIMMLVIAIPWYYLQELSTPGFLDYFLMGEHFYRFTQPGWEGDLYGAAKDQPKGMIWIFLLIGSLPWGLVILWELVFRRKALSDRVTPEQRPLLLYLASWVVMPTLFFSLAGNIIPTYVLPMLPAMAVLLVLLTTINLKIIQQLGTFFAVLFFLLALGAYQFYFIDHKYNQKPVLEAYKKLNSVDPGPLFYEGAETFSVVFYGEGKVSFGRGLWKFFENKNTIYIGTRDMWASSTIPVISKRCKKQLQQGDVSFWYCPSIK